MSGLLYWISYIVLSANYEFDFILKNRLVMMYQNMLTMTILTAGC